MNDKEKAECLIELHKVQMDHFRQTRDLELKVNIALWTVLVLAGNFLYQSKIYLSGNSWILFLIFGIGVYIGHLVMWMMPIQKSEDTDDYYIRQYRNEIQKLCNVEITEMKPFEPRWAWWLPVTLRSSGWSWILGEAGLTAFLIIFIFIVMLAKNP